MLRRQKKTPFRRVRPPSRAPYSQGIHLSIAGLTALIAGQLGVEIHKFHRPTALIVLLLLEELTSAKRHAYLSIFAAGFRRERCEAMTLCAEHSRSS